jgi:hypothetical protein
MDSAAIPQSISDALADFLAKTSDEREKVASLQSAVAASGSAQKAMTDATGARDVAVGATADAKSALIQAIEVEGAAAAQPEQPPAGDTSGT